VPEAGYFVLADTTSLGVDFDTEGPGKEPYDFQFSKWMMKEKVKCIPPLLVNFGSPSNLFLICFPFFHSPHLFISRIPSYLSFPYSLHLSNCLSSLLFSWSYITDRE